MDADKPLQGVSFPRLITAEVATMTGHSLSDVRSILDSSYLERDPALGRSAIAKLETGTKVPN